MGGYCCTIPASEFGVFGWAALTIHWIGSIMTWPIAIILMDGARIGLRIDPGVGPQSSSKSGEICVRAALVIKIAILLPICLSVSVVGALIRFLTACCRPRIAFHRRSDALSIKDISNSTFSPVPPVSSTASSSSPSSLVSSPTTRDIITLCTFNVALLPHFVCMYNGVRPSLDRVHEVLHAILKRNDDIVCIQECFHTGAARILIRGLSAQYPYIVYNAGANWKKLSSGLMIASKLPLSRPQYWPHERSIATDTFSMKGVLCATVQTHRGPIAIINTHLNAPWGEDWHGVHRAQLAHVQQRIQEYTGLPPAPVAALSPRRTPSQDASAATGDRWLAAFVVGDFNIGPANWKHANVPELTGRVEDGLEPAIFFNQLVDTYLQPPDEGLGTFWNFSHAGVGWRGWEAPTWTTVEKRMDHILSWRAAGPALPLVTLPDDGFGPDQPVDRGGRGRREGAALRRDHMDGTSDHLAVRGAFHLVRSGSPVAATPSLSFT